MICFEYLVQSANYKNRSPIQRQTTQFWVRLMALPKLSQQPDALPDLSYLDRCLLQQHMCGPRAKLLPLASSVVLVFSDLP